MRVFILEDSPERRVAFINRLHGNDVTLCSNWNNAITELKTQAKYDTIYLDFDLIENDTSNQEVTPTGHHIRTGLEVAHFIATELPAEQRPTSVIIHSRDTDGAAAMQDVLNKGGIRATLEPFIQEEE